MGIPSARPLRMACAVAMASCVGEWESTATFAFHSSRECDGTEYLNVGTRGIAAVLVGTGVSGMRNGIEIVPMTPLWSRKDVPMVCVGPVWEVRPLGSQIARLSMHVD